MNLYSVQGVYRGLAWVWRTCLRLVQRSDLAHSVSAHWPLRSECETDSVYKCNGEEYEQRRLRRLFNRHEIYNFISIVRDDMRRQKFMRTNNKFPMRCACIACMHRTFENTAHIHTHAIQLIVNGLILFSVHCSRVMELETRCAALLTSSREWEN